jgi:thiamine biosynthesis protein ThiS
MQIILNGAARELEPETTIAGLIALLALQGQRYAVEVNHAIVPRSRHLDHVLRVGDRVEVVQAIGGG